VLVGMGKVAWRVAHRRDEKVPSGQDRSVVSWDVDGHECGDPSVAPQGLPRRGRIDIRLIKRALHGRSESARSEVDHEWPEICRDVARTGQTGRLQVAYGVTVLAGLEYAA
jgi:hypothetical protein